MEHIIQFGITIDDEAIKQTILDNAEKNIMDRITKDVQLAIFRTNGWSDAPTNQLRPWVEEKVDVILKENKDTIVELAAEKLAERLARTKKAKELVK